MASRSTLLVLAVVAVLAIGVAAHRRPRTAESGDEHSHHAHTHRVPAHASEAASGDEIRVASDGAVYRPFPKAHSCRSTHMSQKSPNAHKLRSVAPHVTPEVAAAAAAGNGQRVLKTRAVESDTIVVAFDTANVDDDEAERICATGTGTFSVGDGSNPCSTTVLTDCVADCSAEFVLTPTKRDTLLAAVDAAKIKLESWLGVVGGHDATIALGTAACGLDEYGTVETPTEYRSGLGDNDVAIIVTARPLPGRVTSFGVSCQQDERGRPVAGHLNVNPEFINTDNQDGVMRLLLHEAFHILGFDNANFDDFKWEGGPNAYDPEADTPQLITKSVETGVGNTVTRMVTPRIAAIARQHFDCAQMDGVELEEGGGTGIRLSHFEKRQMGNEIMTAGNDFNQAPLPVVSALTLAYLVDSGWYTAQWENAEPFYYGAGQGCAMWNQQCSLWDQETYFCTEAAAAGCIFDRSAKGECRIQEWGSLPSYFQYLGSSSTGGSDALADFCPLYEPTVSCRDPSNAGLDPTSIAAHEVFDAVGNATCFASTVRNLTSAFTGIDEPRCYRSRCTDESTLQIEVDGVWYPCPRRGGRIEGGAAWQGSVLCPAADKVCFDTSFIAPPDLTGAASALGASWALAAAAAAAVAALVL